MKRRSWAGVTAAGLSMLALFAGPGPDEARACGAFFASSGPRKPSLAHEQVLIVYDAAKETEHFVRSVAFRGGAEPFGFVVPTPSRPDVAKAEAPFDTLRGEFPFDLPPPPDRGGAWGTGTGSGFGAGAGGGVSVLETKKVGSFTAFVLAADDAKSLQKWLSDNGLVSSAEADEWLAHYVQLKFFFVAMRYDPPADAAVPKEGQASLRSETIRISFATPLPYYPYLEPKHATEPESKDRLMDLWVVSSEAVTPIALAPMANGDAWVKPMKPGAQYEKSRVRLEHALGKSLSEILPAGDLVVQTFQDQKASRTGFSDVLFAPVARHEMDQARREKLQRLLPLLDPRLMSLGTAKE